MIWEEKKLCECTEYITDGDHQPAPKADKGVHFIKIKDIVNNQVSFDAQMYVPQEYYDGIPKERRPKKGDILYTVVGSFGIPSYVQTDALFCFERNIALLHPREDVEPRFLYYSLKNPAFYKKVEGVANGSAQKLIPLSKLKDLKILVPDKKVQSYIADILSAYDNLIKNNQRQIKLMEEAAQRIYKEWFVDLRFPGYENVKVVNGVPEGWNKSTVSEVSAVLRRGISPKYNEQAKGVVINQKCIRQTIVSYDESRTQEKKYPVELELKKSDIVICSTGAGTLGRVGQIFEVKENTTLDSHVTLIRTNERVGQQYLFWSLKMQQDYLMNAGKGSTNQLELSRETIGNCEILVPERKIAGHAEKNFAAIHDKMKECSMKITRLREARDLLLPKLMSGEMKV